MEKDGRAAPLRIVMSAPAVPAGPRGALSQDALKALRLPFRHRMPRVILGAPDKFIDCLVRKDLYASRLNEVAIS